MTQGRSPRIWWAQVFLVLTVAWLVTLVYVPFAMAHETGGRPATAVSAGSYLLGGLICHQRSDRSFRLWGVQMPVCARCAGLYGGAALGVMVAGVWAAGRRRSVLDGSTLRWIVARRRGAHRGIGGHGSIRCL